MASWIHIFEDMYFIDVKLKHSTIKKSLIVHQGSSINVDINSGHYGHRQIRPLLSSKPSFNRIIRAGDF